MKTRQDTTTEKKARRLAPIVLGLIFGLSFLFVGAAGDHILHILAIPTAVVLAIAALLLCKRLLPQFAVWCDTGLTFLLAAATGVVLIIVVVGGLMWASFDTEYASGYTAKEFDALRLGDTLDTVIARVGEPLSSRDSKPYEKWIYSADTQSLFSESGVANGTHTTFTFDSDKRVKNVSGQTAPTANSIRIGDGENYLKLDNAACNALLGETMRDIHEKFGVSVAKYEYLATRVFDYSRSPSSSNYKLRKVGFDANGMVVHIWKTVYWD